MMKAVALLSAATLASNFVIPDQVTALRLSINSPEDVLEDVITPETSGWEYAVSAFDHLDPDSLGGLFHPGDDDRESEQEDILFSDDGVPDAEDLSSPPPHHSPGKHHGPYHGVGECCPPWDKTALEFLQTNKHTKVLSYLVTTYSPTLTSLLNATGPDSNSYTVFAPTDKSFRRLRDYIRRHKPDYGNGGGEAGWKRPSNETIEKFLLYHVVEGRKSAGTVFFTATLPTLLDGGEELGGEKQRIRIGSPSGSAAGGRWGGLRINFLSKVVGGNILTSNAIIHPLSLPLFPPPLTTLQIPSFAPAYFSTLLLALSKTNISSLPAPATVFAPANRAWEKLPPAVTAFLFNTEKGVQILQKLLLYHVVPDRSFYSDASLEPSSRPQLQKHDEQQAWPQSYAEAVLEWLPPDHPSRKLWEEDLALRTEATAGVLCPPPSNPHPRPQSPDSSPSPSSWSAKIQPDGGSGSGGCLTHTDLPTLLDDQTLGVDTRKYALVGPRMWVNCIPVQVVNVVARDGVVHVPAKVLVPPRLPKNGKGDGTSDDEDEEREMTVDELVERVEAWFGKDLGKGGDGIIEL